MNATTATDAAAFFYIDGIPTKGTWVALDASTTWESISEAIKAAIPGSNPDEILCADVEGEACHFLNAFDGFNLYGWLEYAAALENSHLDQEIAAAYCDMIGEWTPGAVENAEDAYLGTFDSPAEFAEDLMEQTGGLEAIPENLRYYFDFEKFARDLLMDGYCEHGGHYFSNR